jgi:hypothetical protein
MGGDSSFIHPYGLAGRSWIAPKRTRASETEGFHLVPTPPPNNGMHPTPLHGASHARFAGARVMHGVRPLLGVHGLLVGLV